MVCPRANSQITWKCRDAVASSHPTYRSSKSSTLKCPQTVAMCPIPRLMALKLICFARPCESPSNVESISRKSYDTCAGTRAGGTGEQDSLSTIVDGRNRYRACVEAEYTFDPGADFANVGRDWSDEEIKDYVISANLQRRHLNPGQL